MDHRVYLNPDVNILDPKFKPEIVSGEESFGANLFGADHCGFVYHEIAEGKCILVKLAKPSKVNHILMQLRDGDSYSYSVEVSLDQRNWEKVANYKLNWCLGKQRIYFDPKIIKFIKVIGTGTWNNKDPKFYMTNLQCSFDSEPLKTLNNYVLPNFNVAHSHKGARLITSANNAINQSLLIGIDDFYGNKYKEEYPTPNHLITGSPNDNITIHLSQPFVVNKIKIQLKQYYKLLVDISLTGEDWMRIGNIKDSFAHGLLEFNFPKRAISYIRVTGMESQTTDPNTEYPSFELKAIDCLNVQN